MRTIDSSWLKNNLYINLIQGENYMLRIVTKYWRWTQIARGEGTTNYVIQDIKIIRSSSDDYYLMWDRKNWKKWLKNPFFWMFRISLI